MFRRVACVTGRATQQISRKLPLPALSLAKNIWNQTGDLSYRLGYKTKTNFLRECSKGDKRLAVVFISNMNISRIKMKMTAEWCVNRCRHELGVIQWPDRLGSNVFMVSQPIRICITGRSDNTADNALQYTSAVVNTLACRFTNLCSNSSLGGFLQTGSQVDTAENE